MTVVENVVSILNKEVGYHEGKSNGHWNNQQKYSTAVPGLEWSQGMAWCATFAAWVFQKAGVQKGGYPVTASCAYGVSWYKKQNRWSFYPAIGAQVFFGAGGGTHTGIVYDYDDTYIYTIEGNTNLNGSAEGDGVYKKKRERKSSYTYGYGLPLYPEGIKSADPKWQAQNPKPVEPKPKPSKPKAPAFPGASHFKLGKSDPWVTVLDKAMIKAGVAKYSAGKKYTAGPVFTEWTRKNVEAFQKAQGWTGKDADGYPGKETWKRLFKKAGYLV
ncbi:peptidoglycan-binding protein [Streptomyces collinus]|uniref:peptidoglycan-binding protein n=1 Tax=Streptomyces collinus TaxID=42684 RepID=UPI0036A76EF0